MFHIYAVIESFSFKTFAAFLPHMMCFCRFNVITNSLKSKLIERYVVKSPTYLRYFGQYQVQLSPSLFFKSVRSNDHRQDHSESKGLVMGIRRH